MNRNSNLKLVVLGGAVLAALTAAAVFGPLSTRATPPSSTTTPIGTTGAPGVTGESIPNQVRVNAIIRDFRAYNETGGHPDFEHFSGSGRVGLVNDRLDQDGKPTLKSTRGTQLGGDFKDSAGRPIPYFLFDRSRGDTSATTSPGDASNGITSEDSFRSWFRDTSSVNSSKNVSLIFNRVAGTNKFIFDSAEDEPYESRGGFFPINGELFGNYGNTGKNFHFTTEIDAKFVYERSSGQTFTFTGDDDVWCFIDGRLVIDLGGLHSRKAQTLELDRLTWLENNHAYHFKIFHAERHTTQSNFRVETTLKLLPVDPPPVAEPKD